MRIIETVFDACYVIEPSIRDDIRGRMEVFYDNRELKELLNGFIITEQRIYRIPKRNTFFGIHYQKPGKTKGKLISVVQGRALDYIVDLRPESGTYKQYKQFELDEKIPQLVYIPAGFGHGFFTMEEDTIQAFAVDTGYDQHSSGVINYKDPEIGLKLPVDDVILSDYDRDAAFLQNNGEYKQ